MGLEEKFKKQNEWRKIDWSRIYRAIDFYQSNGFEYLESSWVIEPGYSQIVDQDALPIKTQVGELSKSAEQTFLSAMDKNVFKKSTRLVSVCPCFRREIIGDKYQDQFSIEVGLFSNHSSCKADILFELSGEFFAKEGAILDIVQTRSGADWHASGMKIGSYSNKQFKDFKWSYGVGLVEPIFSQAIKSQKEFHKEKTENLLSGYQDLAVELKK